MWSIKINKDGKRGSIKYDEKKKSVEIDFPDEKVVEAVSVYLNTPQDYIAPQSNQIDDYEIVQDNPLESLSKLRLALTEMYSKLDVKVEY